jgi:hypothetical protein
MAKYRFTAYFENEVLRKRPFLKKEWCIRIIENPLRVEVQIDNRVRFWGRIVEFGNRVFRVVTLGDGVTIHNAFPDRGFKQ